MIKFLTEPEGVSLLSTCGLDYPSHVLLSGEDDIPKIEKSLAYPVVMKIVSNEILHKSDVGGVVVDIKNTDEATRSYRNIIGTVKRNMPGASIAGVLVCEQADAGQEIILGMVRDDVFGPTIMFGLGGIFVDILRDVSFRICPVHRKEALRMIREIKGYAILQGARGKGGVDEGVLADAIVCLSTLVTKRPDIFQVDLNPVRVIENKALVLDVRIGIG